MVYSLAITVLAALAMLFVVAFVAVTVRRMANGERPISLHDWRWFPSPLGLLIVVPIIALLAWRMLPALMLLPILLPFFRRFWRGRGGGHDDRGDDWRDGPPPPLPPAPPGEAIEAQFRPRGRG